MNEDSAGQSYLEDQREKYERSLLDSDKRPLNKPAEAPKESKS